MWIDGKNYMPRDFDEGWIWNVVDMLKFASPEFREKIMDRIQHGMSFHDSQFIVDGYCDKSRAAEFGGYHYSWGENYLYVWLDNEGLPFYAGQANNLDRPAQYKCKTRSEAFKTKIAEGGCHSVLVAKHIHKDLIDEMEKKLIKYLCWRGYPIVNVKDMPPRSEMLLWTIFSSSPNTESVRVKLGDDGVDLFWSWKNDMEALKPIIDVLDSVVGQKWDGECAVLSYPSEEVAV